jgi:hypothetical protein
MASHAYIDTTPRHNPAGLVRHRIAGNRYTLAAAAESIGQSPRLNLCAPNTIWRRIAQYKDSQAARIIYLFVHQSLSAKIKPII